MGPAGAPLAVVPVRTEVAPSPGVRADVASGVGSGLILHPGNVSCCVCGAESGRW